MNKPTTRTSNRIPEPIFIPYPRRSIIDYAGIIVFTIGVVVLLTGMCLRIVELKNQVKEKTESTQEVK